MEFDFGDSDLFGTEQTAVTTNTVDISEFSFALNVAEDDFNSNKRCLFATMIWSGARVLADYLSSDSNRAKLVGKSVIEFGAAAGLPSVLCHALGSSVVCASDYPSKAVIDNLNQNIVNNRRSGCNIEAVSHIWGESVEQLLRVNNQTRYDFVLAAECLWHHTSHAALLQSIDAVLKPGGTLLVTFSHHVPGVEDCDLNFFTLAEQVGFKVINRQSVKAPHMWQEKEATIFLYELLKLR